MPPAQPPEQRQRLQPSLRVGHQLRHYLRLPHVAERVLPRPPRPRRLRRRRQRPALPAARRPLAHACRRRGRRQRLPGHPFLPQSPNLRVCDQPVLRGKQAVSHAPRAVHEPADLSFPRPAKIIVVDQTPPAVVMRKVCGGNRSVRGAQTQQVLTSVLRTTHHRGLDPAGLLATILAGADPRRAALAASPAAVAPPVKQRRLQELHPVAEAQIGTTIDGYSLVSGTPGAVQELACFRAVTGAGRSRRALPLTG